ncbi:hypothetical protein GCM10023115_25640 [Pontixanthobacter gangjinensis]|uniref:Class I SAM-dependent methyltransferase n=1 Tax=Christiangramia aestuarii TaxID=1028746 RepID=A0A7K1LLU7_9FLAO|nr:class I SAM-dependent methyltransferase [Christiangramia aestuarii]MUP41799.1 class I SAM-dependent methyltransferase [Christiangramia aestuarii]
MKTEDSRIRNKEHYEEIHAKYNIKNILYWLENLDAFLDASLKTDTSWHALYKDGLRYELKGKKVLEMGCGNCLNAGVMAALGAEVYANDIASSSGKIVEELNKHCQFKFPIKFIPGDFIENKLESSSFDLVVGKAFLHHLDIPLERLFLKETARLLKVNGQARFFEPAVNLKILDKIRWYIPVGNRPSKLDKNKFKKWKDNDPHPDRSFSSKHFELAGKEFFREIQIYPVGTLERFSRFMKWGKKREAFRRKALKAESNLPMFINRPLARSQVIIYSLPK